MGEANNSGSSPRLRGTQYSQGMSVLLSRFIPAPAGNTLGAFPVPIGPPVHPRACGEHGGVLTGEAVAIGSSPRLRGTPCRRC